MKCQALLTIGLIAATARAQIPWLPQSPRSVEMRAAESLRPRPIDLRPGASAGTRRALALRVHAARDYHPVSARGRFQRILDRVNRLVAGWPGVRFEVKEFVA